jgi:negative regulator of flagellin synthesis FlgM
MRIDAPPYVVDITQSQEVQGAEQAAATVPAAGQVAKKGVVDLVTISSRSRELGKLMQELSALPDVRLDKVALAKQQLQQGSYRVDPKLLAQKMLESAGKG